MNLLRPEKNSPKSALTWTQPLFNHLMTLPAPDESSDTRHHGLVHQVIRHQLLPTYLRSEHPSLEELDEQTKADLIRQSQAGTTRVLTLVSRFRSSVRALDQAGIRYAVYKGPTLAEQAFGDIAARQFGDIDLLIHPRDFITACDILSGIGFQSSLSLTPFVRAYIRKSRRDFTMNQGVLRLDMHQQIARGPSFFALPEGEWSNLKRLPLLNQSVPTLPMEVEKVLLTVHAARHGWDSYKLVLDLAGLFHRAPETDWQRVNALVDHFQARFMFDIGMGLVHRHFPNLAPGFFPKTRSSRLKTALDRHLDRLDHGEPYSDMSMLNQFFRLQNTRFNRARMMLFYLLYPRPEDPILKRFRHGAFIHLMPFISPPYIVVRTLTRHRVTFD